LEGAAEVMQSVPQNEKFFLGENFNGHIGKRLMGMI